MVKFYMWTPQILLLLLPPTLTWWPYIQIGYDGWLKHSKSSTWSCYNYIFTNITEGESFEAKRMMRTWNDYDLLDLLLGFLLYFIWGFRLFILFLIVGVVHVLLAIYTHALNFLISEI